MTLKKKPASPGTSLMAVSLAAALTAGACATPRPALPPESAPRSTSIELAPPPEQVALAPDTARPLAEQPAFTPYDIAPSVENTREVRTLLERHYPPMLRDAGIGGTTMLWVFVNESGEVRTTRVVQSSGTLELDAAAEAVIRRVRFSPAVRDGSAVPVWIQLPVSFSARDPRTAEPQRVRSARELATDVAPVRPRDLAGDTTAESPTFTPYDAAPELRDRTALSRGLETVYPRLLRDAGIGGTVVLWVRIDDEGRVRNTRVVRGSGYDELDQAAQVALRSAEFAPARHAGRPVAVWIQLPITFQARGSSSNR